MDMQNQLLNLEIEHLGQMLKVLSCELTVLQTFLKDKFGSDYEVFRESLLSQQKTSTASSSREFRRGNVTGTARKSTTKQRSPVISNVSQVQEQEGKNVEEDLWEPGSDLDIGSGSDDDGVDNYNKLTPLEYLFVAGKKDQSSGAESNGNVERKKRKNNGPNEQEGVEVENADDVEVGRVKLEEKEPPPSSQSTRKGGRQRKRIWEEFTKKENGSWVCNHCHKEFKCPQADRLELHVKRCRTGGKIPKKFSIVLKKGAPVAIGVGRRSSGGGGELESESDKNENESMFNLNSSESVSNSSGRGRKLDPVWGYFNISTDPVTGKKTAVCKNCQIAVYCKVDPIRKHFYACQEIDKEFAPTENNSNSSF